MIAPRDHLWIYNNHRSVRIKHVTLILLEFINKFNIMEQNPTRLVVFRKFEQEIKEQKEKVPNSIPINEVRNCECQKSREKQIVERNQK